MSLRDRIHNPDRRTTDVTPLVEQRTEPDRREPFVAAWRRNSIAKAGGRYVAVAWREVPAA
jgi:hypothetical protein